MTNIKNLVAAANHVPEWDNGIGTLSAARNPAPDAANDFDFGAGPQDRITPTPRPAPETTAAAPKAAKVTTPATMPAPSNPSPAPRSAGFKNFTEQALAASGVTMMPAPRREACCPILARVIRSAPVKAELAKTRAEQKAYREVLAATEKIIGSEKQASALLNQISTCTDVSKLESLRAEYAQTQGPAAHEARISAQRIRRHSYVKLDSAIRSLVAVMNQEIEKLAPEIEQAETEMFARFGFKREATGLAAKLGQVKARVQHHIATLDLAQSPERVNSITPSDAEEILASFEV